MKKFTSTLIAAALMCSTGAAFALGNDNGMHSGMKSVDANGDGMVSETEFMNHCNSKWDAMPKNKDGAVMAKDMDHAKMDRDKDKMSSMPAMDANGDGLVTQDEFTSHCKAKWDKMPKNKDGMVMMKDMEMMHHDKMMKRDH